MNRKIINMALVVALALSMVGCGKQADNKVTSQTAMDASTIERADDAAIVTSGEASEKSLGDIKSLKNIDNDVQTETAAGGVVTIGDIARAGKMSSAQADFINGSKKTIKSIYIATWNDTEWGADLLGTSKLPAGMYDTVYFYAYGSEVLYDIYVVFEDGTTVTFTDCDFDDQPISGFDILLEVEGSNYVLSYF